MFLSSSLVFVIKVQYTKYFPECDYTSPFLALERKVDKKETSKKYDL